ncbi:hypothetical protein QTP88_008931 [Uroleucon formosanum]
MFAILFITSMNNLLIFGFIIIVNRYETSVILEFFNGFVVTIGYRKTAIHCNILVSGHYDVIDHYSQTSDYSIICIYQFFIASYDRVCVGIVGDNIVWWTISSDSEPYPIYT